MSAGGSTGAILPNRNHIHALDEVGRSAMVAEDQGEAAMQRKTGDANVKAGTNAWQAMILVGQGICYSACLHSHLQQQSHLCFHST